mmetsp:Transcript_24883/g.64785  ORF Transcript_24883/g.64785 Transcript_24883/m.64785 type:complete len:208 (-) Transcript_24883:1874-2497(-)
MLLQPVGANVLDIVAGKPARNHAVVVPLPPAVVLLMHVCDDDVRGERKFIAVLCDVVMQGTAASRFLASGTTDVVRIDRIREASLLVQRLVFVEFHQCEQRLKSSLANRKHAPFLAHAAVPHLALGPKGDGKGRRRGFTHANEKGAVGRAPLQQFIRRLPTAVAPVPPGLSFVRRQLRHRVGQLDVKLGALEWLVTVEVNQLVKRFK